MVAGAEHRAGWHSGTLSRAGGPWDVPSLCLSAISPPRALPCAVPAWRWPVEELVETVGLCGVPAPLTMHVPQVRGAAAQPDVSWAGESQGRERAAFPWPPKTWVLHLSYPRMHTPCSHRHGCLLAPHWWEWLLTRGARCLCYHCLRPGSPDAIHRGAVRLAAHLDVVPHPWLQIPEDYPGVGLDQPLQEGGQVGEQLWPPNAPAHPWPISIPALLPGRLRLPGTRVRG